MGGVVDVAAAGVEPEAEDEVDHDQRADLADQRPAAAVEDRVVDPGRGEDDAEQAEDRPGCADRRDASGRRRAKLPTEPASAHRTYISPNIFQP